MSLASLTFDEARAAADHLRALAEVRAAKPVGLVLLGALTLISWLGPARPGVMWNLGIALALAIGPFLLRAVLPPGTLSTFRLSLAAPWINAGLLALLGSRETARLALPALGELPTLSLLIQGLALFLPATYLVASFPGWIRRWSLRGDIARALASPEPVGLAPLLQGMEDPQPGHGLIAFRTVPANPRDLKRFLRPDFTRHGEWRALLAREWALIVAKDGTRAEAVPRGALKLVTDELETEAPRILCLVRWNQHLHEGRIAPADARALLAWITGQESSPA